MNAVLRTMAALVVTAAVAFGQESSGPARKSAGKKAAEQTAKIKVSGRVVQDGTQEGVSGAKVFVFSSGQKGGSSMEQAVTGADGSFSAEVNDGAMVRVMIRGLDGALLDDTWMRQNVAKWSVIREKKAGPWSNISLAVKVRPSVQLRGRVLDPAGQPVADARVEFRMGIATPIHSGADGVFQIPAVPAAGEYQLYVHSADDRLLKMETLAGGKTDCEIKLEAGADVTVLAVIAGGNKPAAGLQLQTLLSMNGMPFAASAAEHRPHATDAEGKLVLTNLCRGAEVMVFWGDSDKLEQGNSRFKVEDGKTVTLTVKKVVDDWDSPGNIGRSEKTRCKNIESYCLDNEDRFLVCDGGGNRLLRVTTNDELDAVWTLPFAPQAVDCREDGTLAVAGGGSIAILETNGAVRVKAALPAKASSATSVQACKNDVYVCVQTGTGYSIYRMTDQLTDEKLLVKGLRGCCGQMDFAVRNDMIYVAANCESKVQVYDRDGKKTTAYTLQTPGGKKPGWDGCCEPKNVCFDAAGNLYTSESANPRVIKFNEKGEYVESVGTVSGIRGCVRVTVAVTRDGKIYMLDTNRRVIRPVQPGVQSKS